MANGKIEKREEQHLHPRKKAICNKSAKLVLIIAAALWTLQQGRRLQLAADVHVAHSIKESVESLQLEALAAEKSRGGGTTKQTLRLMALAAGKSRGGGTTKQTLRLLALAAGKSRGEGTTKQTLRLLALTERSGKRYKKRTHLALTTARRSCCWRHEAGGRTKLLHNPHCNSTRR
jgi:hypothetical protein